MLLAVSLAGRRADGAGVIAAAVEAKVVGGQGHRAIAARLGRPATTVRGWLRAFAWSAGDIVEMFTALTVRDAPDAAAVWPAPNREVGARALAALSAYGQGAGQRLGVGALTWLTAGITATGGWLFSAPWWASRGQHEPALMPGWAVAPGSR